MFCIAFQSIAAAFLSFLVFPKRVRERTPSTMRGNISDVSGNPTVFDAPAPVKSARVSCELCVFRFAMGSSRALGSREFFKASATVSVPVADKHFANVPRRGVYCP